MLLAPVVVQDRSRPVPAARRSAVEDRPRALLRGWLVAGTLAWFFVPSLRGGTTLGYTAAFWLVAAPLINLAWLGREALARRFVAIGRTWLERKSSIRGATRIKRRRAASSRG